MSFTKTTDEIISILKKYVPVENWELNDFETVVERATEVKTGVFKFTLSFMNLYFDKDMKPVSYDKQHIIDDMLFYDFNDDNTVGAGTYTYLGDL